MTTYINNFIAIAFVTALLLLVSCKDKAIHHHDHTDQQTESVKKQRKEYDAAYVCPMHCKGSGSDQEGTCPTCDMSYVVNENYKKDEHVH